MRALLNLEVCIVDIVTSTDDYDKHVTDYVVRVSTNLSVWEVNVAFICFISRKANDPLVLKLHIIVRL